MISDPKVSAALEGRFMRPIARLALGESLRAVASAAIDVSDGLLADAAHIANASGVAIKIGRIQWLPESFPIQVRIESST